jgi:hypothetical protein
MNTVTTHDIEQRLDILNILIRSVIHLENPELAKNLSSYRSDNVQWVLNMIAETFDQLQDSLDLEYYSQQEY